VLDEDTYEIYHGCNQEWYTTFWQRMAGCGPTVATNLIFYLYHARRASEFRPNTFTKKYCVKMMEEMWKYVTPSIYGVNTTKMFYEAVLSYTKSKGFHVEYGLLDLPKNKSQRPGLSEILKFLEEALLKDAPVAFLNLCNGAEKNLDSWHWVTIISLEYTPNENQIFIHILDEGQIKKIDLPLWYSTTTKGGGFVFFQFSQPTDDFQAETQNS
jgi:hypothetical protein